MLKLPVLLFRTTKLFPVELRELIGFHTRLESQHFYIFDTIILKSIVLPIFNLPKIIRDQLKGSRNIQGFALIRAVLTLYENVATQTAVFRSSF